MEKLTLGEIGNVLMCKRILKEQTNSNGDIPFFKISTFGDKADTFISREIYEEYKQKFSYPKKGDVLISAAGTIGKTVIFDGQESYFQDSNIVWLDNDETIVLNSYLYYFYQTKPWITTNGSIISRLYNNDIKSIKIQYPPLQTQQKIAHTLSILDRKIALNRQINAKLEAMAKTLYDYWFVQFDFPNSEGKPYRSSGGEMVWCDELKREVPKGWEVKKIKDIARTGSGGTPKSTINEYYKNGDIPWINSGELNNPFIVSTENYISQLGLENSSAKLFPANSILMAMYGATAGKTSLISFEATTNQAICAIIPNDKRLNFYLKIALSDLYQYLVNLSSGSARDNLSQDKIKDLYVVVPCEEMIKKYAQYTVKFYEKMKTTLEQTQKLTQLRDFLLPMLMNGQVGVM
ncbi:restriction endonuclease subunit S [Basfia succiniciproducens]|uniref:restriction endonuclease subunit S n=1 Tax=Basfia succiniciproducens TaxID=653940 RepID=UPI003FCD25E7